MTPLPRGHCPLCGSDVALRKGGLVREHQGALVWDKKRHEWRPRTSVCRGSGKAAR